jgi:hypothetical protein
MSEMSKLKTLIITIAILVACSIVGPAKSEQWPQKPVKIIVPYAAGGGSDTMARLFAQRFSAPDFNFWGVTFARDSHVFFASLRTFGDFPLPGGGTTHRAETYLVRGDLALRKMTVLGDNVECPSLSPNNRLIAFKKSVGAGLWRFSVLDLTTMKERPIAAEARSIDDQIEWLDDSHVLYSTFRSAENAIMDVSVASIDGSEPVRVFVPGAESPIVVR